MLEVAALFYGVLASFVMAIVSRNRREARTSAPMVTVFGWFLLAFSAAMGVLLLGTAAYKILGSVA